MTSVKSARVKRIAEFNDALRRSPMDRTHGQVLLSNGVIAPRVRIQGDGDDSSSSNAS